LGAVATLLRDGPNDRRAHLGLSQTVVLLYERKPPELPESLITTPKRFDAW
jgi:hypothetical protein